MLNAEGPVCSYGLSFANGLLGVIEIIIRIQMAKIAKMAHWKQKIESRTI